MSTLKKAFFQLHVAVFLAGFTAILGRLMELNEGMIVWYRLLLSSLFLAAYILWKKQSFRLSNKDLISCIFVGALIAIHWLFFYASIKAGNVSIALVCFAATGSFTALLEPLLLKRAFDWRELLTGLMVIAGIALIFHFDFHFRKAIILGLTAAFFSAVFPVYNKQLVQRIPVPVLSFYEFTGGWLVLFLFLPFYEKQWSFISFPVLQDWVWLLILSLLCTVVAFQLAVNALKKLSPFTTNLMFNLEPLYGMFLAFVLFQEHRDWTLSFLSGTALLILSVGIETYRVSSGSKKQL
jgi:drug/metabolite transporter (DMT)-like permease